MQNLRRDAIRGGVAKLGSQMVNMVLRLGSLMIIARILSPNDFGLIAMVMAPMGVLNIFRDLGLSTAAIQRDTLTEAQKSTLFWLNLAVGLGLTCLVALSAPLFAAFYRDPRLLELTIVLSLGFVLYGLSAQHSALLQRDMRFVLLAGIDTLSILLGIVIGVAMAVWGAGYWAIAVMTLAAPALYAVMAWASTRWVPGLPRRNVGVSSMAKTGGIVTANGLIVYVAYNLDKVLLGRLFGADVLGVYSRAYQLINIPTEGLNGAVSNVAMSTLSRLNSDPPRLRAYFLRSYSILVAITTPITFACAFFAEEVIYVLLGPKWPEAASIFRYLSPTVIIFGMINPTWPLLVALGLFRRSFKLGLVIAPVSIVGYCAGMLWGAEGAGLGFSAALVLWAIPHLGLTVRGTVVSLRDVLAQVQAPLLAATIATLAAAATHYGLLISYGPFLRLFVGVSIFGIVYAFFLLYVMGHWSNYVDVWRTVLGRGRNTELSTVDVASPSSTPVTR